MTDFYAVLGNPIEHSLSPKIHPMFALEEGVKIDYQKHCVPQNELASYLTHLSQKGLLGANITVPFKEGILSSCSALSERAQKAQSVNTLIRIVEPNALAFWYGDTTDGEGLLRDFRRLGVTLLGKRVLILGAGGAVRSILSPLLDEAPKELMICNRNIEKAQLLSAIFDLAYVSFDTLNPQDWDIVINGTSASLSQERLPIDPRVFEGVSLAYDMVYNLNDTTSFLNQARLAGARAYHDGMGMLIEQAAASYALWRDFQPNTARVHQAFDALRTKER